MRSLGALPAEPLLALPQRSAGVPAGRRCQATAAPFADEVPQIITIVELDEGVRFTTNLVDVAPEDVRVGMRVAPVFDHGDDGMTLLRYRPA
jgi:uncharacterized OB-fold protein